MYALNYDTEGKFFNLFKEANNGDFSRLTCVDAALIENRIEKARTPKTTDIKNIIKGFTNEEGERLK